MTSQEPGTPHFVDSDNPDTEVIVVSSPVPVFVDSTGRRRRLLRRLSYAFGGLCMVYGGLVSVSLAGGPVSSSAVLPLPDQRGDDAEEAAGPRPAPILPPSVTARPLEAADVAPRRRTTARATRVVPPRPPAPSIPTSAKPSPSTRPTSAKPTESATVPPVPSSPAPSGTTPVTFPPAKILPAPPAPPAPSATLSSGGSGGGGEAPTEDETVPEDETEPEDETMAEGATVAEPGSESGSEPGSGSADTPDTPESSAAAEPTA